MGNKQKNKMADFTLQVPMSRDENNVQRAEERIQYMESLIDELYKNIQPCLTLLNEPGAIPNIPEPIANCVGVANRVSEALRGDKELGIVPFPDTMKAALQSATVLSAPQHPFPVADMEDAFQKSTRDFIDHQAEEEFAKASIQLSIMQKELEDTKEKLQAAYNHIEATDGEMLRLRKEKAEADMRLMDAVQTKKLLETRMDADVQALVAERTSEVRVEIEPLLQKNAALERENVTCHVEIETLLQKNAALERENEKFKRELGWLKPKDHVSVGVTATEFPSVPSRTPSPSSPPASASGALPSLGLVASATAAAAKSMFRGLAAVDVATPEQRDEWQKWYKEYVHDKHGKKYTAALRPNCIWEHIRSERDIELVLDGTFGDKNQKCTMVLLKAHTAFLSMETGKDWLPDRKADKGKLLTWRSAVRAFYKAKLKKK